MKVTLGATKYNYYNLDYNKVYYTDNTFYSYEKNELDDIPSINNISDKLLKAVCYIHNNKDRSNFDKEICSYLYYWIGDALFASFDNTFFDKVISILYQDLRYSDQCKLCEPIYREINKTDFQKIKLMHDFSSDYRNYKIHLANSNATCNANYKNDLYNYVDNYKKFYIYCQIEQKKDKHCEEFHKFFGDKKYGELSTLSCVIEGTSRRIELLSDKGD
ncbi:PIR Superfamily Protein [Plasmodium ovale curtisi]|uniref:PIR Superfamily Protein n=1 Tax=Plasmodium ovale curtisi TaxID=864141 RepID=A0A1A8WMJ7_PLAOA|nr:PIR Superfamily Protein [Plasmodium ovale curtisi]